MTAGFTFVATVTVLAGIEFLAHNSGCLVAVSLRVRGLIRLRGYAESLIAPVGYHPNTITASL